jgi:tetratricopeptide (TPR) repeat protein
MEDREAIGSWLRAERRARQWDVPEMARQVRKAARDDPHLPVLRDLRRMIRGWEAAEHTLSERYQLLYATAFGIEPEELFTSIASRQPVPATGAPIRAQDDQAPNPLVADSDLVQVEALRQSLHAVISEHSLTAAGLEDWERTVIEHGLATRERPASVMLIDLSADLDELQRALATCRSPAALQRLTRVTAHMAGLMCLTLIKLDERTAFRRWARTARIAAQETGDPQTHSWVRAQEAYGYYYSGEPAKAVEVAQHAQDLMGRVPSASAILAAALEARAQAALGPGRSREARAALHRAEGIFANLDDGSTIGSAFAYSEAQLHFHFGNALTHLHDTEGAWREQEWALRLYPASDFLDRTLTSLDRAYCLAHDGDTKEAVTYATQALGALTGQQRNGMITNRARQIVAALPSPQRALPPVREFRELLQHPSDTPECLSEHCSHHQSSPARAR